MTTQDEFLRSLIRDVPDFPRKGILFKDITPLLMSREGFRAAVDRMAAPWRNGNVTKVASIESRGFIFGAAVALDLKAGFVPMRKPGKLPYEKKGVTYSLEYGTDTIEVHVDAFSKPDNVLIVDDLLATGGSAAAAVRLVGELGASVAGAQFLVELSFLKGREKLAGIPDIRSIIVY
jgi:adenine phosphoribosyltransferase